MKLGVILRLNWFPPPQPLQPPTPILSRLSSLCALCSQRTNETLTKPPATKEPGFLGNFSQLVEEKKRGRNQIKGRAFTADLFRETEKQFRSVWEEWWARRKSDRKRWWRKGKKSGCIQDERKKKEWQWLVFPPVCGLISFSQWASSTIYLVKKQREKHEAVCPLSDGCSEETAAQRAHG